MNRRSFLKLTGAALAAYILENIGSGFSKERNEWKNPKLAHVIDAEGKQCTGAIHMVHMDKEAIAKLEKQGFLMCDGRALDKTKYAGLFAAIGTSYGATEKKFKIPDLSHYDPYKAWKDSQ